MLMMVKATGKTITVIPSDNNGKLFFKDANTGDFYMWENLVPIRDKNSVATTSVQAVAVPINIKATGTVG